MSEKTVKLSGYKPTKYPEQQPDSDLEFHMDLLTKIVFGLWNEKVQTLREKGWPHPEETAKVHQNQIFRKYKLKVSELQGLNRETGTHRFWPKYAKVHGHNWIERRVNYLCTEKYGPKTEDGTLKIVNATAGYVQPNPELFK